jgi:hypothetical protein
VVGLLDITNTFKIIIIIIIIYLFIYIANGLLPDGSDTTIRHNTQITHITQNNTLHSNRNIAHKTTQTIKDTLYTMKNIQVQLQLELNKLILIKNNCTIHVH